MNICSKCGRVSDNIPNEAGEEFAEVLCSECDDSDSPMKPTGPITFTAHEIRCMELRVAKWLGFRTDKRPDQKYYLLNHAGNLHTSWAFPDEGRLLEHYPKFGSEWEDAGYLFDLLTEYNYQPTLESNMLVHKATGVLYAPNEQRVTVWADSPRVAILVLAYNIAIRGRDFENNRRKLEIDNR